MAVPAYYPTANLIFYAKASNALNASGNPCVAGEKVATLVDQSGAGNNGTQTVDDNRFTYQVDSAGRAYLENTSIVTGQWLTIGSGLSLDRASLGTYLTYQPTILATASGTNRALIVSTTANVYNQYIGGNIAKTQIYDGAVRTTVEPTQEVINLTGVRAYTGTKWSVRTNGQREDTITRTAGGTWTGGFRVGALTDASNFFVGRIYEIALYSGGVPSDAEDVAIYTGSRGDAIYNPTNSPPYPWLQVDPNRPIYLISGNSLTHGLYCPDTSSDWPSRAEFHAGQSGIQMLNKASASQGFLSNTSHAGGMITRDPTIVLPFFPPSARKPVLIVWEFTNDIWLSALQNDTQEYTNLQNYISAARSYWASVRTDASIELIVVVPTMLPRGNDATKEGYRVALDAKVNDAAKYDTDAASAWIKKKKSGQSANLPDFVIALEEDPFGGALYDNDGIVLGAPGTQSTTAVFHTDQIHFNSNGAGANRMGRIVAPLLKLLTPPYVTVAALAANGVTLTLTLSEACTGDPTTGISAKVAGAARSATWVLTDSTHITGTLASAATALQAVLWSYDPVAGAMVDADSVEMDALTDGVVTNNSTVANPAGGSVDNTDANGIERLASLLTRGGNILSRLPRGS